LSRVRKNPGLLGTAVSSTRIPSKNWAGKWGPMMKKAEQHIFCAGL